MTKSDNEDGQNSVAYSMFNRMVLQNKNKQDNNYTFGLPPTLKNILMSKNIKGNAQYDGINNLGSKVYQPIKYPAQWASACRAAENLLNFYTLFYNDPIVGRPTFKNYKSVPKGAINPTDNSIGGNIFYYDYLYQIPRKKID
jgi:hypothetical protein